MVAKASERFDAAFDNLRLPQRYLHCTLPLDSYIDQCRQRIPEFVQANYGLRGAVRLNRRALGKDIVIAPFNFFMGLPNFLFKLLALLCSWVRLQRLSRWLSGIHIGLKTSVQKRLGEQLESELFLLQEQGQGNAWKKVISEPLETYLQTRNVAADITAGTLGAVIGLMTFDQFTPGSISAGSVMSDWAAKEHAVSQFLFGETLGSVWYGVFPVSAPWWLVMTVFALVMLVVAVASAFAGFIHDPIQTWTGVHHRRLNKLLDAIEEQAQAAEDSTGYQPKDTFVGRIYDVIDWIKGAIS